MKACMYILLPNPERVPMPIGKAAAQAAHAAVEAYRLTDPESKLHHDWYCGEHYMKVVLMTDDLFTAKMYLESRGVKCALIIDEGRTVFSEDLTPTAIGCALVNKDNPHIQRTFEGFRLYKEPKPYLVIPDRESLQAAWEREMGKDTRWSRIKASRKRPSRRKLTDWLVQPNKS